MKNVISFDRAVAAVKRMEDLSDARQPAEWPAPIELLDDRGVVLGVLTVTHLGADVGCVFRLSKLVLDALRRGLA